MQRSVLLLFTLLAPVAAGGPGAATQPGLPDPEVRRILDAYQAARPSDRDLGVFMLDWAPSLKDARARATREGRPVFFVSTTQLKDAGNLRTGHC
jgi:hypothetical protein